MTTPLEAAKDYTRKGWATVPLVPGQKGTFIEEWEKLRLSQNDLEEYFKPDSNVGIILGGASGGLIDVDCDTDEAVKCAKELLPDTLTSGRGSTMSHFWYTADVCDTLIFKDLDGDMIVELRGDGHQTAVAPSIHPSGEQYKWFNSKTPLQIGYEDLKKRVTFVASAALIARHLPRGGRHDLALSLAGFLLKKLDDTDVLEILTAAWKANGAPHGAYKDLRDIVEDTREKIDNDEPHTGKRTLDEFLPGLATRIAKYFDWTIASSDPTAKTDEGNSRLFIDRYGDVCKYVWEWKKWAFWNGKRWEKDETNYVKYLCGMAIKSLYAEASVSSTDDGAKLAKHALSSLSAGKIKAALELAASHPGMTVSADRFDSNDHLLNCINGTLDLNTGKLLDHNKDDYITRLVPTEYHKDAKAPRFHKFLAEILPDPDTREFVHKALGYSLTGDTAERCLFIAQGDGTNGKSTLLNLCADVLGDYAARAGTEVFLEKPAGSIPNDVAQLKGPRLVLASEVEQGKRLSEAQVKNFTGGSDKLVGRFLYGELFEFEPKFTAWILTNPLPRIKGTDAAIWNRLRIIPFHVVPPKIDKKLPRRLMREAEGVLAWMVEGFVNYTQDDLEPPTEVLKMRDRYRVNEDSVARFLDEMCIRGPEYKQSLIELFEAFREWATDTEEWKMSRRMFNQRLDNLGCDTEGTGTRVVKTTVKLWGGDNEGGDEPTPDDPQVGDHTEDSEAQEEAQGRGVTETQAQDSEPEQDTQQGTVEHSLLVRAGEDGEDAVDGQLPDDQPGALDVWAIDTETTGLNPRSDRVRLLQVYNPKRLAAPEVYDLQTEYDLARDILHTVRDSGAPLIFHNAAFDLPFLEQSFPGIYGWTEGKVNDTMILSQLAYAGLREKHSLEACLERELGISLDKQHQTSDWTGELSADQLEYARSDVRFLPDLMVALAKRCEDVGVSRRIIDLESALTPVLAAMSDRGIRVDVEGWKRKAHESAGIVEFCEFEMRNILRRELDDGSEFVEEFDDLNFGSPKQIQEEFARVGVFLSDTKDSTLAATDDELGLMELLRQHRKATKLRNSYGLEWLRNVDSEGDVHPRWKQTSTATGRMACADPNIQQIPRDDAFRRLFHARPGYKFVVADYSQIELRIAAKIARDPIMMKAYKEGADLHTRTGAQIVAQNEALQTAEMLALSAGLYPNRSSGKILLDVLRAASQDESTRAFLAARIQDRAHQESGRGFGWSTDGEHEPSVEGWNLAADISAAPEAFVRAVQKYNLLVRSPQRSEQAEQHPIEPDDAVQIVSFLGTRTLAEFPFDWKYIRQMAKALSFGLLYGMGHKKLKVYAKTEYGVDLTLEEAQRYRARWLTTYRWIKAWHEREGNNLRNATDLTIKTLAGRIRNDVQLYTERLNTPVQGSGADGLKAAVVAVHRAGYNVVALVHDEIVAEVPDGACEAAEADIRRIMVQEMESMINLAGPDVPVEVEGMISERWEK